MSPPTGGGGPPDESGGSSEPPDRWGEPPIPGVPTDPGEPTDPGKVAAAGEPAGTGEARRAARRSRVRRRRRIVAWTGATVVALVLAVTLWYELESHALGPRGPVVVVTVHRGESVDAVIGALSAHGVIASSLAFEVGDVFHGSPSVLPGSYALHRNQTFAEVRAILTAGPNVYPVDVRPGISMNEVASQVDSIPGHRQGGFEQAAASGDSRSEFSPDGSNDLEGLLGTGEYLVLPGETDGTIVRAMVQRFDAQAGAAGLRPTSAAAVGLTPYEAVTAASIVEKEGYIPVNMSKVARVIYNRLAAGLPLQMDSTVLYALGQDGGPVTAHDLELRSPYNTYLNTGLTPTPICMPSADALDAALHPTPGSWLYFVLVQKDGVMAFADTYAEQLANEQLAKSRGLP